MNSARMDEGTKTWLAMRHYRRMVRVWMRISAILGAAAALLAGMLLVGGVR